MITAALQQIFLCSVENFRRVRHGCSYSFRPNILWRGVIDTSSRSVPENGKRVRACDVKSSSAKSAAKEFWRRVLASTAAVFECTTVMTESVKLSSGTGQLHSSSNRGTGATVTCEPFGVHSQSLVTSKLAASVQTHRFVKEEILPGHVPQPQARRLYVSCWAGLELERCLTDFIRSGALAR